MQNRREMMARSATVALLLAGAGVLPARAQSAHALCARAGSTPAPASNSATVALRATISRRFCIGCILHPQLAGKAEL